MRPAGWFIAYWSRVRCLACIDPCTGDDGRAVVTKPVTRFPTRERPQPQRKRRVLRSRPPHLHERDGHGVAKDHLDGGGGDGRQVKGAQLALQRQVHLRRGAAWTAVRGGGRQWAAVGGGMFVAVECLAWPGPQAAPGARLQRHSRAPRSCPQRRCLLQPSLPPTARSHSCSSGEPRTLVAATRRAPLACAVTWGGPEERALMATQLAAARRGLRLPPHVAHPAHAAWRPPPPTSTHLGKGTKREISPSTRQHPPPPTPPTNPASTHLGEGHQARDLLGGPALGEADQQVLRQAGAGAAHEQPWRAAAAAAAAAAPPSCPSSGSAHARRGR